jgi:hypothetical protein
VVSFKKELSIICSARWKRYSIMHKFLLFLSKQLSQIFVEKIAHKSP